MARISISCLCPASWHFTVPLVSLCPRQRLALLGLFLGVCLLLLMAATDLRHWGSSPHPDKQFERHQCSGQCCSQEC